jgi:hypothetical protein
VVLANTTFINNKSQPDSTVPGPYPPEGGAINVEDQTMLRIYHSRFINNEAHMGGAVNGYRADIQIYNSVLLGNRSVGTVHTAAFGGSINLTSTDLPDTGYNNYRSSILTVKDSFIQGAYGGTTTAAHTGGCIHLSGDWSRIDGDGSVPDIGTIEQNRATGLIERTTLTDCDVHTLGKRSGMGGAVLATITDLTINDSVIVNSDALGDNGAGGGLTLLWNSVANISNTNFGYNTAGLAGAALYVHGSELNLSNSSLLHNEVSPGFAETQWGSMGSIFTSPDNEHSVSVSGNISQNTISSSVGMSLFEIDQDYGPVNHVQYNGNEFYENTFGDLILNRNYVDHYNVSQLTQLDVNRPNGTSTDKSVAPNINLPSQPTIVDYVLTPNEILSTGASGDPADITEAHLAVVWQAANSPQMDSVTINEPVYLTTFDTASTRILNVAGINYEITLHDAADPAAQLQLSTGGGGTNLEWQVLSGSLILGAIDNGAGVHSTATSGQVSVPAEGQVYRYYIITKEGGAVAEASTSQPILDAPDTSFVLYVERGSPVSKKIEISNIGGSVMTWSAQSGGGLLDIEDPQGDHTGEGWLTFSIDASHEHCGEYTVPIQLDGGDAGTKTVNVTVKVVEEVYSTLMPATIR